MKMSDLKATLTAIVTGHRDRSVSKPFATMIHGPSGIGKTETVEKLATELDMACVTIHMSELEPGDATGYPRVKIVNGEEVSYHAIPEYLPRYLYEYDSKTNEKKQVFREDGSPALDILGIGEIVANLDHLKAKFGSEINQKVKGVILLLDELNRIADLQMMQSVFQLPGSHRMHTYRLPSGCCVISCVNPNTEDYQVNDMDSEKAFMRRWLHLKAEPDVDSWLDWAREDGISSEITSFIAADSTALYEDEKYYKIPVRRTPDSFKLLNTLLTEIKLPDKYSILSDVIKGAIGEEYGQNFLKHRKERLDKVISPEELLNDYPKYRDRVLEAGEKNRLDYLQMVCKTLMSYLRVPENLDKIDRKKHVPNIERFAEDLPPDFRTSFVSDLVNMDEINEIVGTSKKLYDIVINTVHNALSLD